MHVLDVIVFVGTANDVKKRTTHIRHDEKRKKRIFRLVLIIFF